MFLLPGLGREFLLKLPNKEFDVNTSVQKMGTTALITILIQQISSRN